METQRSFLFIALVVVSFLLYQAWETDHAPKPVAPVVQTEGSAVNADLPSGLSTAEQPAQAPEGAAVSAQLITVETDVLRLAIDPKGGDIVSAKLLAYPETLKAKDQPFAMLRNDNGRVYYAMSGLVGKDGPDAQPERPVYQSAQASYRLAEGQNELVVELSHADAKGVSTLKRFSLKRGAYAVEVGYTVKNMSAEPKAMRMFAQLKRDRVEAAKPEGFGMGAVTYLGGAYSAADKRFEKYDFEAMDEKALDVKTAGGWVAMLQHYFVTAWVPASDQGNELYSKNTGGLAIMGVILPTLNLAPGVEGKTSATLYVGPKNQEALAGVAQHLDLVVDYGFLWWIGQPLFWLLTKLHGLVGNWGVAIILLTIVVRGAMYKLTAIQYRSAARMRQLQPKLTALKERCGDDRQKFGQEMMALYQKEKVNPLGGCLPLLVQLPVFMALYWVLLESVELRHALFIPLWIEDLSMKDPFFILPVLYTASMWLVTHMTPTPPNMDEMQAKMMKWMPVMMGVLFLFFPAGLVLYWLVSNLLTIAQQQLVTRQFEKAQGKA
ncbi:MAG: membrane protein insertase YidC [Gammaproteobacteria bacterium]|nr:membrane protein insertase YidC [Gammaproteobacteria bacterium]